MKTKYDGGKGTLALDAPKLLSLLVRVLEIEVPDAAKFQQKDGSYSVGAMRPNVRQRSVW